MQQELHQHILQQLQQKQQSHTEQDEQKLRSFGPQSSNNSNDIKYNTSKNYDPITKIRSLIHSLDAELMLLCNQCSCPKNKNPMLNNSKPHDPSNNVTTTMSSFANRSRLQPSSLLAKVSPNELEQSSPVHVKTLSSVYRSRVIDAYRNRRIFTVHGNYHTVRRQLLRRGWVEKLAPGRYAKLQALPEEVLLQHARRGNDYETVAISKIISHFPAFFIWQPKQYRDLGSDVLPLRNRVRRSRYLDFSTKVGLIGCAEQEKWYRQQGVSGMSYPRFYRLCTADDRTAFIEDFRRTACRNLLRYISERSANLDYFFAEDGTVPVQVLEFALTSVQQQIDDIDNKYISEGSARVELDAMEWREFMQESNRILTNRGKFKSGECDLAKYAKLGKDYIERLERRRADYAWDGYRNLWILKPGYQCRGIGIAIKSSLEEILHWSANNQTRRYIAQKYVERPLLVYKTKFDIRQYMLLTIGETKISIWMYRDCYLRFSSQEYTMEDLRECVHLTNNSVQKRYRNKSSRDTRLPRHNMWSLDQFKAYLKHQYGTSDMWETKIYRGFKENLIAVVLASLEETEFTENAFELYGCDFMLDEKFNPILIEINSTPDLSPSTEVTARICPSALKDVLKVVVDLPRNARSSTGLFEMVYDVVYKPPNDFEAAKGVEISGKPLPQLPAVKTGFFQSKVFRKPAKIVRAALKTPMKRISGRKLITQPPTSKQLLIQHQCIVEPRNPENGQTRMPAIAKETLALQYTRPK